MPTCEVCDTGKNAVVGRKIEAAIAKSAGI
jgi:hypothetical protein